MLPRSWLRLGVGSGVAALLLTLLMAGPVGAGWFIFPTPVSPNGQHIYNLYELISIPAIIIFLFVEIALLIIILRFRRRSATEVPAQVHGSTVLEATWTLIPLVIVLLIAAVSFVELQRDFLKPANAVTAFQVHVVGRQYVWSYTYPQGFTVTKTLVVPTGKLIRLKVDGADVIHSWWVPSVTGKTDAVPGYSNYTWLDISHPGKWHGECAELCGVGHYSMQTEVVAMSPADYQNWVQQQLGKKTSAPA